MAKAKRKVKVRKPRFTVKLFENGNSTSFAIFRRTEVSKVGRIVYWRDGAEPFRGYAGLGQEEADCILERLEREG